MDIKCYISASSGLRSNLKILGFLKDNLRIVVRSSMGSLLNLWNIAVAQFVISNSLPGPPNSAFRQVAPESYFPTNLQLLRKRVANFRLFSKAKPGSYSE